MQVLAKGIEVLTIGKRKTFLCSEPGRILRDVVITNAGIPRVATGHGNVRKTCKLVISKSPCRKMNESILHIKRKGVALWRPDGLTPPESDCPIIYHLAIGLKLDRGMNRFTLAMQSILVKDENDFCRFAIRSNCLRYSPNGTNGYMVQGMVINSNNINELIIVDTDST